jgi:hypothetical protein
MLHQKHEQKHVQITPKTHSKHEQQQFNKKNTSNTPTIATMWRYTPLLYNYYERNTALMPPIMLFVFATLLGPAR